MSEKKPQKESLHNNGKAVIRILKIVKIIFVYRVKDNL